MATDLQHRAYLVGAAPWPRSRRVTAFPANRGQEEAAPTGVWVRRHGLPMGGFTLLELLVAVAIFAIIGAMAYGGLQTVMDQQYLTEQKSQRLEDLQKAYRIMQRDMEQIIARRIRNEFGDELDALVGGSGFDGVEFSRAGHPNPAGFLRSEILRVAYQPDQDSLLRMTWRVLDRAQDSKADEQLLIEELRSFSMRFLDENDEWSERWPPLQASGSGPVTQFPRAVEVQLELDDIGILNWIFRLPETFVAGAQPLTGGSSGGENEAEEENDDEAGGNKQAGGQEDEG